MTAPRSSPSTLYPTGGLPADRFEDRSAPCPPPSSWGPKPSRRFYQLDEQLLRDPTLTALQKMILIDLFHREGKREPISSIPERAAMLAVSHASIQRAEDVLVERGFLLRKPDPGRSNLMMAAYPAPLGDRAKAFQAAFEEWCKNPMTPPPAHEGVSANCRGSASEYPQPADTSRAEYPQNADTQQPHTTKGPNTDIEDDAEYGSATAAAPEPKAPLEAEGLPLGPNPTRREICTQRGLTVLHSMGYFGAPHSQIMDMADLIEEAAKVLGHIPGPTNLAACVEDATVAAKERGIRPTIGYFRTSLQNAVHKAKKT